MSDFFDRFSKVPLSQKVLLLLLIMAAIFLAFLMLAFNDIEKQILEKREEQEQLSTEQARLQGLRDQVATLEAEVDEEMRRREGYTVDLPVSADISDLLAEVHETAQDIPTSARGAKLEISQVRIHPHLRGADYTRIPVDLRLSGTFDQVLDFCWALARMSRIVHVRSLSLRAGDGRHGAGPPSLNVNMTIEAFFRPEG